MASSRMGRWGLMTLLVALPAAAQDKPARVIDIVHMGGNDCPPCVEWRKTELPKLEASPEFKAIRFTHVTKSIRSTVPPQLFFPSEIKHLQPALKLTTAMSRIRRIPFPTGLARLMCAPVGPPGWLRISDSWIIARMCCRG